MNDNPQSEYPHYNKNSVNPSTCVIIFLLGFLVGFLACHIFYTGGNKRVDIRSSYQVE